MLLKTPEGSFPVKLEGRPIPLGEEFAFKFLRQEPGRVILTPLSSWEYWQEALPFLKELPGADSEEGEAWIRAAVRQGLPLGKEVLFFIRRWSLTAEKDWGVKVNPEVFAFLFRKMLPVTPGSVLLSLYLLYPRVQKEVWLKARPFLFSPGEQDGEEETVRRLVEFIIAGREKAAEPEEKEEGLRSLWTGLLRAAARFLAEDACRDQVFPHWVFYLSPGPEQVAGWAGRGTEEEKGYSFHLTWHSPVLGRVEITGVERKEELSLLIATESTAAGSRPEVLKELKEIKSYLENRGWKVKHLFFSQLNGGEKEEETFVPPRIDGWM